MNTRGASTGKLAVLWVICAVTLVSVNNAKAHRLGLPPINLAMGDQRELGQVHPAISQGDAAITKYVNFMLVRRQIDIQSHQAVVQKRINRAGGLNRELRIKFHRLLQIAQTLLQERWHLLETRSSRERAFSGRVVVLL